MGSCAPLGSRAEVIDALTEREQDKELKGQRKKRKAEDRALRAAAARTAAKRSKRKVPKRPWTPEPEGDGEKENVPPAAAPVQTAADPVVPAIVPAVSPALLAAARIAYPSLSLSLATASAVCPSANSPHRVCYGCRPSRVDGRKVCCSPPQQGASHAAGSDGSSGR